MTAPRAVEGDAAPGRRFGPGWARRTRIAVALSLLAPWPGAVTAGETADTPRRVACLGDSNTAVVDPASGTTGWCERLAASMSAAGVEFDNHAAPGATVCEPGWESRWAGPQLERALAGRPDVVVAAFGTNDLAVLHRRPEAVVECHAALRRALPEDVVFLVALAPPAYEAHAWLAPGVSELGRLLRASFPPRHLVDFESGFTRGDFEADGLHANEAGQRLRAERARAVLEGVLGPGRGSPREGAGP